jgi:hypothetical protein
MTYPEFVIKDGANKWKEVTAYFKDSIPEIRNIINKLYKESLGCCFDYILKSAIYLQEKNILYIEDLKYFSEIFDIELHKIIAINIYYELSACCTTFCTKINDKNVMYRTLDWPLEFLRKITYKMITQNYTSITWFGCIGIFTGCNSKYGIAINYRSKNNITIFDIFQKIMNITRGFWSTSFLLRYIFEKDLSEEEAEHLLINSNLISSTYFTFCPVENQPKIIQRNHKPFGTVISEKKRKLFFQTNCDINEKDSMNLLWSEERIEFIKKNGKNKYKNYSKLIESLDQFPVVNEDTIYASVLSPSENDIHLKINLI